MCVHVGVGVGCSPLGSPTVSLLCGCRYCLFVYSEPISGLCWRFTLDKCFIIIIIITTYNDKSVFVTPSLRYSVFIDAMVCLSFVAFSAMKSPSTVASF